MKAFPVIATCSVLGLLGWAAISLAKPAGASGYRLEFKTIQEQGIRVMPLTTYTYWQGSRKLWERKIYQEHGDSWISPSGSVWILGKSSNPPSRPGLYLVDLSGDLKGQWNFLFQPSTNASASRAIVLRPGVEQFQLVDSKGEARITFVGSAKRPYSTIRQSPDALEGLLERTLKDPVFEIPEFPARFSRFATLVAKKASAKVPEKVWRQLYDSEPHGPKPDTVYVLRQERECPMPTFEIETATKRLALTFTDASAIVRVLNRSGQEWEVDLVKSSGLSAAEAARIWGLHNAKEQAFYDATPISNLQVFGDEKELLVQRRIDVIEAFDAHGDRHLLDVSADAQPTYSIKQGVAAREPREPHLGLPIVAEKRYKSMDGIHTLRVREWKSDGKDRIMRMTLLRKIEGNDVELWSKPLIHPLLAVRILDDGEALLVYKGENVCSLAFPDTGEGATIDITKRGLKEAFDVDQVVLLSVGPKRRFKADRVEFLQADEYKLIYQTKPKSLAYRLFRYGQGYAQMDLD